MLVLISSVSSDATESTLRQAPAGSRIESLRSLGSLLHLCCICTCERAMPISQVRIFTSMDLVDTKDGKKILRQYDHTLVAET